MPDTVHSIYSEHDEKSARIRESYEEYIKEIKDISKILKSTDRESADFQKALKRMKEIVNIPYVDLSLVYAYTDENGNDNYTTLGGKYSFSNLAIEELKKNNLEVILNE